MDIKDIEEWLVMPTSSEVMPTSSEDELKNSDGDYDHPVINENELHNYSSSDDKFVAVCSGPAGSSIVTTGCAPQNGNMTLQIIHSLGTHSASVSCNPMHKTQTKSHSTLSEDDMRFKGNADFSDSIMDPETPFQFIKYFLKDHLLKRKVQESRLYSTQNNPEWPFNLRQEDDTKIYWYKHPNVQCKD
jgi:hypothetical protein